jgi:anti-sigma regulatory factor (Ser/Thr protein kinase)
MAARHKAFARFERRPEEGRASGWMPLDLGGHEIIGRLHMRLRAGAEAAGEGRHSLDRLDGKLQPEQLAELRLLVSELLTNGVRHGARGEGWITLDVEIFANAVRVVVTDRGPGFEPPAEPEPHPDRPGGWGLCLVDRLADRWGVHVNGATSVWFEVDRAGFATAA